MLTQSEKSKFCHEVRYRLAVLAAWMKRTGRKGGYSINEVPDYITIPSNKDISTAEVFEFERGKQIAGVSYVGYMTKAVSQANGAAWFVTTWMGDVLATVIKINSRRVRIGYLTDVRGTFWARGIDGKMYYGWHNGAGMYCKMRLSKDQKDMRQ